MIVAVDAHYKENFGKFVSIEFKQWTDPQPAAIHDYIHKSLSEYIPGEFYKRELPGLLEILKSSDLTKVSCVVVDGYVYLDDEKKPGLGFYLYKALEEKIPVVGVAKTSFLAAKKISQEVYRGESKKPLYITSIGIPLEEVSLNVQRMHGDYRIPHLLKLLDRVTKQ